MAQDLTQWEYRTASTTPGAMQELNKLGEEGWEVAANASGGSSVVLKRPKQPQQQPSRPKDDDRYYGR